VDATARVGTSGWNYPHWRERFYPPGVPTKSWLAFLAERLSTVEVNGTFYSLTRPAACDAWRSSVPPDFLFAVKGSRYITHMLKLRDFRAPLANFFASGILRLGAQLGPVLWQLPPQLPFDRVRADAFLSALPVDLRGAERWARRHDRRTTGRAALTVPDGRDARLFHALEVRHASWLSDEALRLLERRGIALVAADTAGRHPRSLERTSRDLAYVRLHGARRLYEGHYTDRELADWAGHCAEWAAEGARVFVYFDNDRDAAAVHDALRLDALVRGRPVGESLILRESETWTPRDPPSHFGFRRSTSGDPAGTSPARSSRGSGRRPSGARVSAGK
jgi:uncharacterized protein YecE (DUF72 family)